MAWPLQPQHNGTSDNWRTAVGGLAQAVMIYVMRTFASILATLAFRLTAVPLSSHFRCPRSVRNWKRPWPYHVRLICHAP